MKTNSCSAPRYMAKGVNIMRRATVVLLALCASGVVVATEYDCPVNKKVDYESEYAVNHIETAQFSVNVEEGSKGSFISRCSFSSSANKVTCDRYQVDKVVFDKNAKIKKYYVFGSQFDVQIFPDLSFVENNGRGSIAYGQCHFVAP